MDLHCLEQEGHGYESFGEQTNNLQISPKPQRQRRNGGDFPEHGDDDDEPEEDDDDDDDDEGYGPYGHRNAQ
eukprot:4314847-Amphidinium_carterae.1